MPSLNTENAILSNAIKVNSSYNVGIGGAASGSFKLNVTGTSNLTGALSGTSATFSSSLIVGSTPILYGNVAIKSNSATSYFGLNVIANGNNNFIALNHTGTAGVIETEFSTGGSHTPLHFVTGGSTRLTIASTGAATFSSSVTATNNSVGFAINATSAYTGSAANNPIISFGRLGSAVAGAIGYDDNLGSLYVGTTTEHNFLIKTNNSTRVAVTSGGNVGIGMTGYGDMRLVVRGATSNNSNFGFRVENSGANALFQVRNDGKIETGLAAESPYNLTIAASANCHIFSDGTLFRATSSGRYKTDVEDLSVNTFDLINRIRPVWYRSLCERDKKDWSWYGFIAEELAEIDPRFVHFGYASEDYIKDEETNETKLKDGAELRADGVMYDRLTVLLMKGMQEQQAQIEAQQQQINSLINR